MLTQSQIKLTGHKKAVVIGERDFAMLQFLWRHRAATFRTIYSMFYSNIKMLTCYTRLDKLRRQGFVSTRGEDGSKRRYWCLERRGMAYLAQNMDALKSLGFKPQSLYHDHLASSILLGDWYQKLPAGVEIITEQELISRDLQKEAPGFQDGTERRPDGLWRFQVGPVTKFLALELELHAKPDQVYADIIRYYDNNFGVEKIIWVVTGETLLRRIHTLSGTHATLKELDHLFLRAEDVIENLWQAVFKNDNLKGICLAEYLSSFRTNPGKPPTSCPASSIMSSPEVSSKELAQNVLLNFGGCFVKSSPYSKSNRRKKT